jgi:DNA-binding NarL/FixJ family response regulator
MDGKIPFELTHRETEVFSLLMQGCKNNQIATYLHIKNRTVEAHLMHIYQKLGVTDRTNALIKALSAGWFVSK